MSDLYRSAISARLSTLPHLPPIPHQDVGEGGHDEDEDEVADSIGSLPGSGMGPPACPTFNILANGRTEGRPSRGARARRVPNANFAPILASGFFAEAAQSSVPAVQLDFRIYYTPPRTMDGGLGSVMVCHHGAGTSGLSFACFAKEVSDLSRGECGALALDARRHGMSILLISRSWMLGY